MDAPLLRLLDANANRAREALRVVDDYGRFVLDDAPICQELKTLRHELTNFLTPWLPDAILHRDTPGDVGTAISAPNPSPRQTLGDMVTAAGKRLSEALRAIEESLKTCDPPAAAGVESLRYRFYEIERRLALTLRPVDRFSSVMLYVLITESVCRGNWLSVAEQAILGEADCIQLREKNLADSQLLSRAKQLVDLCKNHGKLCIINDRPDMCALSGADGVHLGQDDLPPAEARRIVGHRAIVGVSTHNIAQAHRAMLDGADYIGVGPIFKSATKPRDFLAGIEYATEVAADPTLRLSKVGIAGIGPQNIGQVLATGIRAIAVASAVTGAQNVAAAAKELKTELLKARR